MRSLGDFYTLKEAAVLIGISHHTLRAFIVRHGSKDMHPSHKVSRGKIDIYLYSPEDIERIKRIRRSKVIPATIEECDRRERARLDGQLFYWRKNVDRYTFLEDEPKLKFAKAKVKDIEKRKEAL